MLFSKRILALVLVSSLIIPGIITADREVFLPIAASSLTFDQFYNQAASYVNHPVRISGQTTGNDSKLNATLWSRLLPDLRFTGIFQSIGKGIQLLLATYTNIVILNEQIIPPSEMVDFSSRGGQVPPYLCLRYFYGIDSTRIVAIVFRTTPHNVPYEPSVLGVAHVVYVDEVAIYYLDFISW